MGGYKVATSRLLWRGGGAEPVRSLATSFIMVFSLNLLPFGFYARHGKQVSHTHLEGVESIICEDHAAIRAKALVINIFSLSRPRRIRCKPLRRLAQGIDLGLLFFAYRLVLRGDGTRCVITIDRFLIAKDIQDDSKTFPIHIWGILPFAIKVSEPEIA